MLRPVLRVISGPPAGAADGTGAGAADAALAEGVAQGDRAAVSTLTRRCLPMVTGLATRMLRDPVEAEDVAQDVFVKVWRNIGRYDPDRARLETWVGRIAMNACYDRLRKRREALLGEDTPEQIDGAPNAERLLDAADMAARVRAAVDSLPERQRAALELCHFQERTNIEAAEILDVSVEAVESLLARGRRKLKALLAEEQAGLLDGLSQLHGGEP